LPALKAEAKNVTVSGLSSGAFMAVQFHVAHSSVVRGVGILAGGPYYCAQGSALWAISSCMSPNLLTPLPDLEKLLREVRTQAAAKRIDDPKHLGNSRVWLFSGGTDTTVNPKVVDLTEAFYRSLLAPQDTAHPPAILHERLPDAGHAMPSPAAQDANACSTSKPPYINQCGKFDAPGRLLTHLLGKLNPPPTTDSGELLAFSQDEFLPNPQTASMAKTAYLYIPPGCRAGGCRVHIAFHGCQQQAEQLGETYVRQAGYNRWAASNRLIVLYPQTVATPQNPKACWDWWGYTGADYALQSAPQIHAVKAMLDRLSEGK
jgi:poly(3-hydroxybutyrate) depolymerase